MDQVLIPGAAAHNKSLQRTFDPPPIFAAAKTGVASNAAKLRRYTVHGSRMLMARALA